MWILVLNDISNPEITRFELVMTTHYTNSDSPAVVPQVQEEVTHTKEKVSHITFVFKYCICFEWGKCSLNHANHCPDCCTTNDQRMGLALWKRL